MPAQNAAVLPLPLDPVTTTETRDSRSRSTATASSSAATRARQTPSPYFGRSNTKCPVSEVRSHLAEPSLANFGDKRGTCKSLLLVPLIDLKFLVSLRQPVQELQIGGTSNPMAENV